MLTDFFIHNDNIIYVYLSFILFIIKKNRLNF
jgi:hypothetical protein